MTTKIAFRGNEQRLFEIACKYGPDNEKVLDVVEEEIKGAKKDQAK